MYRCKLVFIVFLSFIFLQSLNAKDSLNLDILKALEYLNKQDFSSAIDEYERIYNKTKQRIYFKEAIKIAFENNSPKFENLLKKGDKFLNNDADFMRLKAIYLISKSDLKGAKEILQNITKFDNSDKNFAMLGSIAMFSKDKQEALSNYKKAYAINPNDEYLIKMSKLTTSDDIYPMLKSHIDKHGCSVVATCLILSEIYINKKEYKNALQILGNIFELTNDRIYLERGISLLVDSQDKNLIKDFLDKYEFKDEIKMEVFSAIGDHDNGYKMAKKIYDDVNDISYLAMTAIFEYERNSPNISKEALKNVIAIFEKSAEKSNKAMFLNYYGYILIDHDIDYKKGINLVKKALELEPNSPYYLDSLAWGYFKLKDCKTAKEIMNKALNDTKFSSTDEAKDHAKKIDECENLKGKR